MRTVSHRELRNQSAVLLRAVEAGESIVVTNRGKPVAVVRPYEAEATPIERLREADHTRPAQSPIRALRGITRLELDEHSTDLLRDARGLW